MRTNEIFSKKKMGPVGGRAMFNTIQFKGICLAFRSIARSRFPDADLIAPRGR